MGRNNIKNCIGDAPTAKLAHLMGAIPVLAVPFPIQLLPNGLGKLQKMAQLVGPWSSTWKNQKSSWTLASTWPSLAIWRMKSVDLSSNSAFQISNFREHHICKGKESQQKQALPATGYIFFLRTVKQTYQKWYNIIPLYHYIPIGTCIFCMLYDSII